MSEINENTDWLQPGELVDYSSVIGEPPTRFSCRIRERPWLMGGHTWVAMIDGVAGGVAVKALRPSFSALAEELRTQDNAGTAHPLFIVQQRRRIWGMDPDYCDDFEWHSEDHEYRYSADSKEIQQVIRDELAIEYGADARVPIVDRDPEDHGWIKVHYVDTWDFVTAHFTRKAAQRYIDENRHNLTDPRVYASSQYRCPEWNAVVGHLKSIGDNS